MQNLSLDLRYNNEVVAQYEFEDFVQANDFVVKAKALADGLAGSVVKCKITIFALTEAVPPRQFSESLTLASDEVKLAPKA